MSTRDVNRALYLALHNEPGLEALGVSGAWDTQAPENTPLPLVIYFKSDGQHVYTLKRRAWEDLSFTIKGIARDNKDLAERIDNRLYAVLNRQQLPLDNGYMMILQRETDLSYTEKDGGATFYHVGGIYTVMVRDG